jgi:hypothetical protein
MTDKEAMAMALDALETEVSIDWTNNDEFSASAEKMHEAIAALKERLAQPEPIQSLQCFHCQVTIETLNDKVMQLMAQPEQEPVAWLLTDKNINSLQVDSIQRLINRLNHAHHTDLCVRINGQDEWFQADWLKHMVRATPPQRTWVDLSDEDIEECFTITPDLYLKRHIAQRISDKLKQKNGYAEEKNT